MGERNLDFDKVIDRRGTGCIKYDLAKKRGMPEDVLPLWVADMDFKTSSYVEDALVERAKEGIFGYGDAQASYYKAVRDWMKRHHGWEIAENWLIKVPGIVTALAMAVKAYTEPGEGVLIQLPVYYPFFEVIEDNGRKVVASALHLGEDNRYHIDFEDFEEKAAAEDVKLFLLCNPHNPVGRAWSVEELERLGDICVRHGVIVVSDEIHQDFVFKGKHQVFANLKKEYGKISVTCTAPSKTFNLAGLALSNIMIPSRKLRNKFRAELAASGIGQIDVMGIAACEAAYGCGEEWYQAMFAYIKENIEFTRQYVEGNMRGVKMVDSEGTYLVWLDFRGTGLTAEELDERIIHRAKLWLDSGEMFGEGGSGFQRINVACPRSVLEEALRRLKEGIE